MRKLIIAEFLTLDGVMEASEEWQPPYVSEDVSEAIQRSIQASDAALLGRVTYQMFASYWPTQTKNEFGVADKLNSQPKFVVSSTLDRAEWNNTIVLKGPVEEEIRRLKQQLCSRSSFSLRWAKPTGLSCIARSHNIGIGDSEPRSSSTAG